MTLCFYLREEDDGGDGETGPSEMKPSRGPSVSSALTGFRNLFFLLSEMKMVVRVTRPWADALFDVFFMCSGYW